MNHIALLLPSVETAAKFLRRETNAVIGAAEIWEGEGTREIYVGHHATQTGLLLLMEPAMPGAYARALQKRGPGLHHIAIDVLNIHEFIAGIAGSGWLLHPRSLETLSKSKTAYLARPGMPMLIEVQERPQLAARKPLVTCIEVPNLPPNAEVLLRAVGLDTLVHPASVNGELVLQITNKRVSVSELLP
jgi:hypothetical protein